MTAEQIRNVNDNDIAVAGEPQTDYWLREIAAQLAELNETAAHSEVIWQHIADINQRLSRMQQ